MAELIFYRRGTEVLRFALDDARRMVVGRGDKCDLVLPDPDVSRQQAALYKRGAGWVLEDLSTKGTLVGGKRADHAELRDGIDIALGPWSALFREHGAGAGEQATEITGQGGTVVQQRDERRFSHIQLRLKSASQKEKVLKLEGKEFTLGKDDDCDIVLDDRFVSGKHVKVSVHDSLMHVLDLRSKNGTWLGNVKVHDIDVPVHTLLKVGETEVSLEPFGYGVRREAYQGIIGNDASVKQLIELIERVAPSTAAVCILGESGTGKELVASALHNRSMRVDKPFIPVNCAAISKELIESELFGHEKGAFTGALNARRGAFEEAHLGTLFLDEIGELSLDLQAKLLRALESGEIKRVGAPRPQLVDVRVVAATNRDLKQLAREGKFREDLYYRLCVVPLHLPPLRNRRSDVPALAEHFVLAFTPRGQKVHLAQAAIARLQEHHWPGNIRELKNVIHRALLLRRGPNIEAADLAFDVERNEALGVDVPEVTGGQTLEQMLAVVERQIVESALKKFDNNKERVAKELGVARSTLFKRLKDWGLTNEAG